MRDEKRIEYLKYLQKEASNERLFDGTVAWYFLSDGEGFIYCEQLEQSFFVHESALPKNQTLKKGQKVKFTLYVNFYMAQIESVRGE